LQSGARLGPYEILSPLGVGGMGEVYRAADTNLKRQVAIKVLPKAVAADADRLARFQREAEVLAALNHPHIAAIYGLERAEGATALVMELVEGPTLADRIATGAIPIPEALPIATQVAEALEAAHERGIIHRDLKPANIKVRADGTVKVLDFGLAKAMDSAGAPSADATNSPTMMASMPGIILGTAAYMSPEQARGKTVDQRADIWAFGCVLFEMLTDRILRRRTTEQNPCRGRPFSGDRKCPRCASRLVGTEQRHSVFQWQQRHSAGGIVRRWCRHAGHPIRPVPPGRIASIPAIATGWHALPLLNPKQCRG